MMGVRLETVKPFGSLHRRAGETRCFIGKRHLAMFYLLAMLSMLSDAFHADNFLAFYC